MTRDARIAFIASTRMASSMTLFQSMTTSADNRAPERHTTAIAALASLILIEIFPFGARTLRWALLDSGFNGCFLFGNLSEGPVKNDNVTSRAKVCQKKLKKLEVWAKVARYRKYGLTGWVYYPVMRGEAKARQAGGSLFQN